MCIDFSTQNTYEIEKAKKVMWESLKRGGKREELKILYYNLSNKVNNLKLKVKIIPDIRTLIHILEDEFLSEMLLSRGYKDFSLNTSDIGFILWKAS